MNSMFYGKLGYEFFYTKKVHNADVFDFSIASTLFIEVVPEKRMIFQTMNLTPLLAIRAIKSV